jgi:hypothetical protein
MPAFSSKERLFAQVLNKFPLLKHFIKTGYIYFCAFVYRKNYSFKILHNNIPEIKHCTSKECESFFGYYDKSPINANGECISHTSKYLPTSKLPNPKEQIDIVIAKLNDWGFTPASTIASTFAYNWQQGARAHWISDNRIIYNDFDAESQKYIAKVFSTETNEIINFFDFPIQDSFKDEYFLSLNYRRLFVLNPDYGYRNLPPLSNKELNNLQNDGIWKIDFESGKSTLLHSLQDVVDCENKSLFSECKHIVNHIMILPSGKEFIFIHRYYHGKQRLDRLMYSDFGQLKVVLDYGMISHYCWIDGKTIIGFVQVEEKQGFFIINIETGKIEECTEINKLCLGDGHPSCYKEWIVFDTYPNKDRMQWLLLCNLKTKEIFPLIELFQNVKYLYQTRCDLHPRFSPDGKYVFFDTVYTGKRQHCYIDVSKIIF